MATVSNEEEYVGVLRETRDSPPSDYLFKIKSFLLFSECDYGEFQSAEFEAGSHKWMIVFFPNGEDEGRKEYISMYLSLANKSSLADGKEVNAFFKLFLFDQIRGKYLSVQGAARRFDRVKSEWGFSKFLSLEDFKHPANGYLVNDTCFLGAEVYVIHKLGRCECLSIGKFEYLDVMYTWKLNLKSYSEMVAEDGGSSLKHWFSDEFYVGSYKWRLGLSGKLRNSHCNVSINLFLVELPRDYCAKEVKAIYRLNLSDQENRIIGEEEGTNWFDASSEHDFSDGWDNPNFMEGDDTFEAVVTLLCETYPESLDD